MAKGAKIGSLYTLRETSENKMWLLLQKKETQ